MKRPFIIIALLCGASAVSAQTGPRDSSSRPPIGIEGRHNDAGDAPIEHRRFETDEGVPGTGNPPPARVIPKAPDADSMGRHSAGPSENPPERPMR